MDIFFVFKWVARNFRKIEFHIVATFLSLLISSAVIIISFSYFRTNKAIRDLSEAEMHYAHELILDKINDALFVSQTIAEITTGIVGDSDDPFSEENINEFINTVLSHRMTDALRITLANGEYISANDLTLIEIPDYVSRPGVPLPLGSRIALRRINPNSVPLIETWEYYSSDLQLLGKESVEPIIFNPKEDSLFKAIQAWPATAWSVESAPKGFAEQHRPETLSISITMPAFDADHNFLAAVSADISLEEFGNALARLKLGKSGRIFIVDGNGVVVVPPKADLDPVVAELEYNVLNEAYNNFKLTDESYSSITYEKAQYLIYAGELPIPLEDAWTIVFIVPFEDFSADIVKAQKTLIFISAVVFVIFGILIYFFAKHIANPIISLAKDVDKVCNFEFDTMIPVKSQIEEILTLDKSITTMCSAVKSFGKYIPKEIIKSLVQQGQEIALGGERKSLVVMFSDVKDFTTISESLPVELLMPSLAAYFDVLSKIILESEGTIDKYIGDSIMAFWGAPQAVVDPVKKACLTALKCHRACNLMPKENRLAVWQTRFGLHTGEVIVGNIGTNDRMNYTIIGDTVNAGSRITGLNKQYQTSIIISDAVVKEIGNHFVIRPLDCVTVKGKTIKLTIYELLGTAEGEMQPSPEQRKLCEGFTRAYAFFNEGKFDQAKALFSSLSTEFPSDYPTKLYLERIAEMEKK